MATPSARYDRIEPPGCIVSCIVISTGMLSASEGVRSEEGVVCGGV